MSGYPRCEWNTGTSELDTSRIYEESFLDLLGMQSAPLFHQYHANAGTENHDGKYKADYKAQEDIDHHEADKADSGGDCGPNDVTALQTDELQGLLKSPKYRIAYRCICFLSHGFAPLGIRTSGVAEEQRQGVGGSDHEDTCANGQHDLLFDILFFVVHCDVHADSSDNGKDAGKGIAQVHNKREILLDLVGDLSHGVLASRDILREGRSRTDDEHRKYQGELAVGKSIKYFLHLNKVFEIEHFVY